MTQAVIDTRTGGQRPPMWLLAVLDQWDSGPSAMVAIQPNDRAMHEAIGSRMRRKGFRTITALEWISGAWPIAERAYVDVVRGELVRVYTGASSLYVGGPMKVTPLWAESARARRVRVALLPPASLAPEQTLDLKAANITEMAADGRLLGAMAIARFDLPVARP